MALINSDVIPASATAFEIEQSLRLNSSDSPYLSWTPSSTSTSTRTFTVSVWVKLGNLKTGSDSFIWSGQNVSGTTNCDLNFKTSSGQYYFQIGTAGNSVIFGNQLRRDTSAWYHLVAVFDTTQATNTNRIKLYVNGEQMTYSSGTFPSQNTDYDIGGSNTQMIGALNLGSAGRFFDGYISDFNFIDGQALDPTYFGETGDYGEWKPKAYTGTYGTNGFYLPFKQDYEVEGFSAVTYSGNGSTQYIGGVGFQPDLVWIKRRDATAWHLISDAVRGTTFQLASNSTSAASSYSDAITSFETDGFYLGDHWDSNGSGDSLVAWCWNMGGSSVSNTDGTITSTVRANPTYGQSIVKYTGATNSTVGHGLSQRPEFIMVKRINNGTDNWVGNHIGLSNGDNGLINLNTTSAEGNISGYWGTIGATTFGTSSNSAHTNATNDEHIAYCFHSVTGYSKIGSYTGNGSTTGPSVTTGFKPAFIIIKCSSSAGPDSSNQWVIADSTRSPTNTRGNVLKPNVADAESTDFYIVDFNDTSFQIKETNSRVNANGETYIYMAFADTREFAYWLDQSGNNNDWTSNNLTESDISVDSPTNNFCTLNPLDNDGKGEWSEGNTKWYLSDSVAGVNRSTFSVSSGKWYWEILNLSGGGRGNLGIIESSETVDEVYNVGSNPAPDAYGYFGVNGTKYHNNASASYGATYGVNDIIGVALDMDAGTITFYKNNATQGQAYSSISGTYSPAVGKDQSGSGKDWTFVANFGQDSSFAGNKTAQGNTDDNEIGDFYYTPPSGFLALCTANLPDPDVIPSEHFNTVLYTGNGSTQSITGVGFQPDFLWVKNRSSGTDDHQLYDAVRTAPKMLKSNDTTAEINATNGITSFNSDGFTTGSSGGTNNNNSAFVSWNWKANGSGVSNTNGSITSTVSANQDAGFSIVGWTGNGNSDVPIGHGLNFVPELYVLKGRDASTNWNVYTTVIDGSLDFGLLPSTAAFDNSSLTAPTATTIRTSGAFNVSGENNIAYCFHSVDGFSKVGSYTGNGSTDGTFVYTGFRPAFVMVKRTDSANYWMILDDARESDNPLIAGLYPNLSDAETNFGNSTGIDFLSNGFKHRDNVGSTNASGGTYIYIAFAENPFKHTNAR